MNKKFEIMISLVGLTITTAIGIVGLLMESKRKTILTEEDKNDIAEKVADNLIGKIA